jgi:cellulose synthase/poly-beta-1,6-N-acetylglucosamine synthase-like glycosyltransferase
MIIFEIIFWLSLFLIFYAYLGYPMTLWILSIFIKKPILKDDITPLVSLAISVYNEEDIIEKKIENSIELDYPDDLLEFVVISDGSTDRTNEIIQDFAEKDSRIKTCILEKNRGKSAALNECVPNLNGEIVLFSDANSFYPKDLIKKIVRPFKDDRVGLVTGWTKYSSWADGRETEAVSIYSKLEMKTKSLESKIGSCVGADGAVFAIRKELYEQLNPEDINDLVIPFKIIGQKKRCLLEKQAYCREETAGDLQGEHSRQVRITNRTLRAIFSNVYLFNSGRFGLFSFQLFSHKFLKLMGPFFLSLLILTNCIIAFQGGLYLILLLTQIFVYFLAFLGYKLNKRNELNKLNERLKPNKPKQLNKPYMLFSLPYSFLLVNISIMQGWFLYLSGETYTKWKPER